MLAAARRKGAGVLMAIITPASLLLMERALGPTRRWQEQQTMHGALIQLAAVMTRPATMQRLRMHVII
jgi:hypothetical protein